MMVIQKHISICCVLFDRYLFIIVLGFLITGNKTNYSTGSVAINSAFTAHQLNNKGRFTTSSMMNPFDNSGEKVLIIVPIERIKSMGRKPLKPLSYYLMRSVW